MVRGYEVRLPPSYGIKKRYFGMKRHGGAEEALRQARLYRDALVERVGEPKHRGDSIGRRIAPYRINARAANKSGLVGVYTDGVMWVAYYSPRPNKQVKRRFSIDTYGEEGALILAAEWRARMIKRLR